MVLKFKVQRSNKSALKLFRHQNIKATYILTHELPIIQHFSFPFFTPMQCKYLTGSFRTQIIKSFHWNDYTRYFTQFSQRAKVSKACLSSKSFFFRFICNSIKTASIHVANINQVSQQYYIEYQLFLIDSFYEWNMHGESAETNTEMTLFKNAVWSDFYWSYQRHQRFQHQLSKLQFFRWH